MKWYESLVALDDNQKNLMICYLLGRSGMSDEDFTTRCMEMMVDESKE